MSKRFDARAEHLSKAHQNLAIRVGGMLFHCIQVYNSGPLYKKLPSLDDPEPVKVMLVETT